MSSPPAASRSSISSRSGQSSLRIILQRITSNFAPSLNASRNPRIQSLSLKPLRSKFSAMQGIVSGSISVPTASFAPKRRAYMAKMPVPVPISSTVLPLKSIDSIKVAQLLVVSCSPVPKAVLASSSSTTALGSSGVNSTQGGRTHKCGETDTGCARSRHHLSQSFAGSSLTAK